MPHSADSETRTDTGLACLVLIARVFGLPADPGPLRHRFAAPVLAEADILRAARHVGLKARAINSQFERLDKTPLPAIAQHKDGHYFIVAKLEADKVLIQDPLETRPQALPRDLFEAAWSGRLILLARRATALGEAAKFGFKWFIPALIKYRKLFAEVLIASFFLQLFALITPLFFQVVIDKVLVHQGLTTLDVLAFGLIVVSLFEVLLGGLRTYVFSHTTNRIDVQLGCAIIWPFIGVTVELFRCATGRRFGGAGARAGKYSQLYNGFGIDRCHRPLFHAGVSGGHVLLQPCVDLYCFGFHTLLYRLVDCCDTDPACACA